MKFRYYTLDVFTDEIFGGNPLAVFPDASGLTERSMQLIAREFNLSETVFVTESRNPECTCRLRIFTPEKEIPFAGHPTIGTAFMLAELGAIYLESNSTHIVFEEEVGPVPVTIRSRHGKPVFAQLTAAVKPEVHPVDLNRAELAAILGVSQDQVVREAQAVSCGLPFLLVELSDMDAVSKASLNIHHWRELLADEWASSLYVYAREAVLPSSHLHARMFAPGLGVMEDPATGSAASALATALALRDEKLDGEYKWIIEQGFEMKRPSFIEAQVKKTNGHIVSVKVGGTSVRVAMGMIDVPYE